MLSRKKLSLLLLIICGILNLTGCGKNSMKLSKAPNASSAANRVNSGGITTANANDFGSTVALTYYAGVSAATGLQGVSVSRSNTNLNRIRISAPNLANGTPICVITGAVYTSCVYGTFFTDIGEERCGAVSGGSLVLDLARPTTALPQDFNVVTVLLQAHLSQFNAWFNGTVASTDHPTLAQGQVSANIANCQ